MKLNRKLVVLSAVAALILCTGCSGISASGSVSPATFLLPGFGSVAPVRCPAAPCETNAVPAAAAFASLN